MTEEFYHWCVIQLWHIGRRHGDPQMRRVLAANWDCLVL